MAEYRVVRSFGGNKRESKVELSAKDAHNLIDAGYVAEIGGAAKKTTRKRAAKKTASAAALPAAETP